MRVIIVSCVFPPEPVVSGRTSAHVAEELARRGHEVVVITTFPSRPGGTVYNAYSRRLFLGKSDEKGYELWRCFSFLSRRSSLLSRLMENVSFGLSAGCAALLVGRPDVIYANTWPLFATGIQLLVSRVRHVPLVISVQDVYPESLISQGRIREGSLLSRCLRRWDGMIARRSRAVILISQCFRDVYTRRGVSVENLHVIPNWGDRELFEADGADEKRMRAMWRIPEDAFLCVYAGSIGEAAGVETLIRSSEHFGNKERPYLVIAGEGSKLHACQDLRESLGCERIVFHSPWLQEDTARVLRVADVLLLPTKGSQSLASLPSKAIGYMLAGRPIIAMAKFESDLSRLIRESDCGWVIEPDQPKELAIKIQEIMGNSREEREKLGRNGRLYALQNLTRDVCLPLLVDVVEGAVGAC